MPSAVNKCPSGTCVKGLHGIIASHTVAAGRPSVQHTREHRRGAARRWCDATAWRGYYECRLSLDRSLSKQLLDAEHVRVSRALRRPLASVSSVSRQHAAITETVAASAPLCAGAYRVSSVDSHRLTGARRKQLRAAHARGRALRGGCARDRVSAEPRDCLARCGRPKAALPCHLHLRATRVCHAQAPRGRIRANPAARRITPSSVSHAVSTQSGACGSACVPHDG